MSRVCLSRASSASRYYFKYSTRALPSESLCKMQTNYNESGKMASWQLHSYGDIGDLKCIRDADIPKISSPNHVLVKVHAASVNPLDIGMIAGYGRNVFKLLRLSIRTEFPLTLGRDFSGTVVNKGTGVGDGFSIGDAVWGVLMPSVQGSHAEYVLVDKNCVSSSPGNLTYIEAASILYAGLTAYSGLMYSGGLKPDEMNEKRVLVLGPAGGVGSMAVQILKAGGATVICSCSSNAIPLITSLGVDVVLDRNSDDFEKRLLETGPYDVILDCAGLGPDYASKYEWKYNRFVTFTSPLLEYVDEKGIVGGLIKSAVTSIREGRSIRWAFIKPTIESIHYLKKLVEQKQLKPVVSQVFPFEKTPEAFKALKDGHSRGKIVIDVIGCSDAKDKPDNSINNDDTAKQ